MGGMKKLKQSELPIKGLIIKGSIPSPSTASLSCRENMGVPSDMNFFTRLPFHRELLLLIFFTLDFE